MEKEIYVIFFSLRQKAKIHKNNFRFSFNIFIASLSCCLEKKSEQNLVWNFAGEGRDVCYLCNCVHIQGFYLALCSRMALLVFLWLAFILIGWYFGLLVKYFDSPQRYESVYVLSIFPKYLLTWLLDVKLTNQLTDFIILKSSS